MRLIDATSLHLQVINCGFVNQLKDGFLTFFSPALSGSAAPSSSPPINDFSANRHRRE